MDFSNYSARDFVLNESFQKWVIEPDEEVQAFWDDWLIVHPEKLETVVEARLMIQNIKNVIEKNVAKDRDEVWDRIQKDISTSERETARKRIGETETHNE
jgi:hypothetical protein